LERLGEIVLVTVFLAAKEVVKLGVLHRPDDDPNKTGTGPNVYAPVYLILDIDRVIELHK
jgi:hypothetical protein